VRPSQHKDVPYDPAPYVEIQTIIAAGGDASEKLGDVILDTKRVRPKFVAARLNKFGIPAPNGSKWDWKAVVDERWNVAFQRFKEGRHDPYPHLRGGGMYVGPGDFWQRR
jgi:hypothetical protein